MKLEGKWALVTGGSRGIGKGICLGLAKEGCNVVVNYVNDHTSAMKVVDEIRNLGVEAKAYKANVAVRDEVNSMIEDITKEKQLDILISNAGVVEHQAFLDITPEAWKFQMDINLLGSFNIGQEVAKYLVEKKISGKVVFITSFNQDTPNGSQGVYNISKSGVKMLAKTMALELAEHGINVNTVAAGGVLTDINKKQVDQFPGLIERLEKIVPLHRWGTVEDIANAAVFLASNESDYITGSSIFVEGGIMINNGMMINLVD